METLSYDVGLQPVSRSQVNKSPTPNHPKIHQPLTDIHFIWQLRRKRTHTEPNEGPTKLKRCVLKIPNPPLADRRT